MLTSTTVIAPVGPEICALVPPNIEAKIPVQMAPYTPAAAPAPDNTPKLILPMINKKLPYAIITVIVGTVVSKIWLPMPEAYVVGQIPLALPSLQIPNFFAMNIMDLCQAGLTLALLGYKSFF